MPIVLPKEIREALPKTLSDRKNIYFRDLPREALDEVWKLFSRRYYPCIIQENWVSYCFNSRPGSFPVMNNGNTYYPAKKNCRTISVSRRVPSWFVGQRKEHGSHHVFSTDNKLAYVCVDEPQGFNSSVPPVIAATADVSVIRFHGRNKAAWERDNTAASGRFNYLYNDNELREWEPRINELAGKTKQLHVIFNNCYDDKAMQNARQTQLLLDQLSSTSPEYD